MAFETFSNAGCVQRIVANENGSTKPNIGKSTERNVVLEGPVIDLNV